MLLTKRKASSLVHGGRYIEGTVVGDEVGNTVGNAVGNLVGDDVGLGVLGLGVGISTTITSVGIGVGASPQRLHVAAHFSLMPTPSTVMLSQNFPRRASFLLNQVQDLACPMSLRNRKLESSLHGSCVGSAVEEGAGVGFLPFPLLGVEHLPFPFPVLVDVHFAGFAVAFSGGLRVDSATGIVVVGDRLDASTRQRLQDSAHTIPILVPSDAILPQYFDCLASFSFSQWHPFRSPMLLRKRKLMSLPQGSPVVSVLDEVGIDVEYSICLFDEMLFLGIS